MMFSFWLFTNPIQCVFPKQIWQAVHIVCLSFHLSVSLPDPGDHKNTRTLLEADTFPISDKTKSWSKQQQYTNKGNKQPVGLPDLKEILEKDTFLWKNYTSILLIQIFIILIRQQRKPQFLLWS